MAVATVTLGDDRITGETLAMADSLEYSMRESGKDEPHYPDSDYRDAGLPS